MKNSFDNLINLAKAAKFDSGLIRNHINHGIHKRINAMIEDISMMINITDDDDYFLARLNSEKKLLESALEVYKL